MKQLWRLWSDIVYMLRRAVATGKVTKAGNVDNVKRGCDIDGCQGQNA